MHIRASMKKLSGQVTVTLVKETGAIYRAYCPCKAGLSGYCSHIGALLLKIVQHGHPCTSKLCAWTAPSNLAKAFEPQTIDKIPFCDPEKTSTAPQQAYPGTYKASACGQCSIIIMYI